MELFAVFAIILHLSRFIYCSFGNYWYMHSIITVKPDIIHTYSVPAVMYMLSSYNCTSFNTVAVFHTIYILYIYSKYALSTL